MISASFTVNGTPYVLRLFSRSTLAFTLRAKCPIWSIFWSVFSCIQSETGKYGPEKTPYLDTFHAVYVLGIVSKFLFHFKTSLSVIKPVNFYSSKHLVATSMYFHQIMQPLTRGFRLLTILEKKIHLTSSAAF